MSALAIEETLELYHNTVGGMCNHRTYYMTCTDFDALWTFARGCCQICKTPELETKRGKLCIDHMGDYGRGNIRGLLCDKCNALMRRVDDRTIRFPPAEVYRYRRNAWFSLHVTYSAGRYINRKYP